MNIEEVKRAIYSFTYGVYIVTTRLGDSISGMTAVWVTQVSKDPVAIVVGMTPESATTRLLMESHVFAVNVLSLEQKDLAYAMGRVSSSEADKFVGVPTFTGETGSPILSEAIAYLECRVISETKVGSHWAIIGEVINGAPLRDLEPSVYRNGKIF